mgnify:CR=1 FL=1
MQWRPVTPARGAPPLPPTHHPKTSPGPPRSHQHGHHAAAQGWSGTSCNKGHLRSTDGSRAEAGQAQWQAAALRDEQGMALPTSHAAEGSYAHTPPCLLPFPCGRASPHPPLSAHQPKAMLLRAAPNQQRLAQLLVRSEVLTSMPAPSVTRRGDTRQGKPVNASECALAHSSSGGCP